MNRDLEIVEAKPEFRNKIKRKIERYGSKVKITDKTGISPYILRQCAYNGKVRRGSLEKMVKCFAGPNKNVDDYINE